MPSLNRTRSSILAVPLLRDDRIEGAFVVTGAEPGTVHATPDRARPDLRRPGGDRDRKRAPVRRGAGAHARPRRGAAAADRDRRGAEGHQPLGVRPADGVRYAGDVRRRALRRLYGHDLRARRRGFSLPRRAGADATSALRRISRGPSRATPGRGDDRRPGAAVGHRSSTFPIASPTRNTSCRWLPTATHGARPARRAAARRRTGSRALSC